LNFSNVSRLILNCLLAYAKILLLSVISMGVHYILHSKLFYDRIHIHHHQDLNLFCSTSSYKDSWIEFLLMDIFCQLIPHSFFVQNYVFILITFCFKSFQGALDHSGFYIPGSSIVDCRYHFYHHKYVRVNYAEYEFFDKLMGTYYLPRKNK